MDKMWKLVILLSSVYQVLYQIAEYSRCPVYQVLNQVTEDLDTNLKKKHGVNLYLCRASLLAQVKMLWQRQRKYQTWMAGVETGLDHFLAPRMEGKKNQRITSERINTSPSDSSH